MNRAIIILLAILITKLCNAQTLEKNESIPNDINLNSSVVGKYRLFETENMWTFIKLNTQNGLMWQVQFDVEENNRFETILNFIPLVDIEKNINNRFTLYPTQNMWTFILLDKFDGRTWQVQWSIEPESRAIIPIE